MLDGEIVLPYERHSARQLNRMGDNENRRQAARRGRSHRD